MLTMVSPDALADERINAEIGRWLTGKSEPRPG
jgi:hypothetical protein